MAHLKYSQAFCNSQPSLELQECSSTTAPSWLRPELQENLSSSWQNQIRKVQIHAAIISFFEYKYIDTTRNDDNINITLLNHSWSIKGINWKNWKVITTQWKGKYTGTSGIIHPLIASGGALQPPHQYSKYYWWEWNLHRKIIPLCLWNPRHPVRTAPKSPMLSFPSQSPIESSCKPAFQSLKRLCLGFLRWKERE